MLEDTHLLRQRGSGHGGGRGDGTCRSCSRGPRGAWNRRGREMRFIHYKSYLTHRRTLENKIKSVSSRFSIFYDSMSSDWDLYHVPSFKKLKAEPFISVSLCLLLFAFGSWNKVFACFAQSHPQFAKFRSCHIFKNGQVFHLNRLMQIFSQHSSLASS